MSDVDAMRATICDVLESAIKESPDEDDAVLNRSAVVMQDDGSIVLATWAGNIYLITVHAARAMVQGE